MAWQLIYTSAPRLLEAGRSGFGTVARHRAIHPLLVTAIERDSQFDRSAGGVVLAHRILTAGGSRFHVLTCIRDAGADYTGRTNHIAHHIVIEPREIAALGSTAPTPADVLAQMNWLAAWSDSPRWLDGTDQIALSRFHRRSGGNSAWQSATGEARRAALLQPSHAACLILPPGGDALALISESLGRTPAQSWQATFTTSLQPGDEYADFQWVAIPAAAPMRANAESGRTVLDLTAPHTLPIPAAPISGLAEAQSTSRSAGDLYLPVSAPLGAAPVKMGSLFDEKLAAAAPRPARSGRAGMWIGLALAVVAIVGSAFLFLLRESSEVKGQREQIRNTFANIFGDNTAVELAAVNSEKLAASVALAMAAADTVAAMRQQNIPPPLPEAAKAIQQYRASGDPAPIPARLLDLFDLHSTFHSYNHKLSKVEQSAVDANQLDELRALRDQIGNTDSKLLPRLAPHLIEDTRNAVEKLWADRLSAAIEHPPGERPPAWFRKHFEALPRTSRETEDGSKIEKLIADWEAVVAANGNTEKLDGLLKERRHLWPKWLETMAKDGKPQQMPAPATAAKTNPDLERSGGKNGSAEKERFEGDLIIVLHPEKPEEWTLFVKELQKPEVELRLKTSAAAGSERALRRRGDGFLFTVTDAQKAFVWNEKTGEFSAAPGAPAPPYEVRLLQGGKCLQTAWVADHSTALRVVENGGLQRDNDSLRITNREAQDLCEKSAKRAAKLVIELPDSCSPELPPEHHRIPIESSGAASMEPMVTALNNRIIAEKKIREEQQAIADGKASPRLAAALVSINKPIEVDNAKREAAKKEAEKKKGKKPASTVADLPLVSHSMKPEDFGRHLQSYGRTAEYEDLFNVGTKLMNSKATTPLPNELSDAAAAAGKAIARWKSRLGEGEAGEEKDNLNKSRDQKIQRLNELLELINAWKDEPKACATAAAKAAESQRILDALTAHPLHDKKVVPPGEYRLLIRLTEQAPWLPLVRFKAP